MEEEVLSLMNETCTAAEYTLQLYIEHMNNRRYIDADMCLTRYSQLVHQAQTIEDHTEVMENRNIGSFNTRSES